MTDESPARASEAEISAGRSPLTAQHRIQARRQAAERGGTTFSSGLSVAEFAALRSIGFTPVDQVMGGAVYQDDWPADRCGQNMYRAAGRYGQRTYHAVVLRADNARRLYQSAGRRAIDRLCAECAGVGGDGVVGVRVRVARFYSHSREFLVTGTAVRASGSVRPPRPFTSDLSGEDFAKLVRGGWLPVALVMGVGVTLQHSGAGQLLGVRNWEARGLTELVHAARADARTDLTNDVRHHGGLAAVLRDMSLEGTETPCYQYRGLRAYRTEGEDRRVRAVLYGTALVPFARTGRHQAAGRPLTILRLDGRDR